MGAWLVFFWDSAARDHFRLRTATPRPIYLRVLATAMHTNAYATYGTHIRTGAATPGPVCVLQRLRGCIGSDSVSAAQTIPLRWRPRGRPADRPRRDWCCWHRWSGDRRQAAGSKKLRAYFLERRRRVAARRSERPRAGGSQYHSFKTGFQNGGGNVIEGKFRRR
jgi:hypothetical protein